MCTGFIISKYFKIMLLKSSTKTTTKTIPEIWQKYSDVSTWNTWDKETESSSLDGQFVVGGTGTVKPKGSPSSKFTLTELTVNKSFTVTCAMPGAQIQFHHSLNQKTVDTVEITHSVELVGLLAPVWKLLIGTSLVKGLDSTIENLV